ncbi:MAG: GrpB family protein [Myxococcaceae bacterium]|nr:MAG: GrpB family protein [Myxococcaceae bacterium]
MRGPPVVVVPYDPGWPESFEALRTVLAAALGEVARAIHHVGSTAVPGLPAKPILDVDVEIASRTDLPESIRRLGPLGYRSVGELGIAGREAFDRLGPDVPRDGSGRSWPEHHVYVCASDATELRRHLLLRDFLRANPARAAEYAALKRALAVRHREDREAYTDQKSELIASMLGDAVRARGEALR